MSLNERCYRWMKIFRRIERCKKICCDFLREVRDEFLCRTRLLPVCLTDSSKREEFIDEVSETDRENSATDDRFIGTRELDVECGCGCPCFAKTERN